MRKKWKICVNHFLHRQSPAVNREAFVSSPPNGFEPSDYRRFNNDLALFPDEQLLEHWNVCGESEGRRANSISSREDFARLTTGTLTLEIGPFFSPYSKQGRGLLCRLAVNS